MEYKLAVILAVLATGCLSTEPEPTDRDTGLQADGAAETDTTESPVDIPKGCPDFETYDSRAEGSNAAASKNISPTNPQSCSITKSCTSEHRLIHWCLTDCDSARHCQMGGSWKAIRLGKEHDWAWVVAFVCGVDYLCDNAD